MQNKNDMLGSQAQTSPAIDAVRAENLARASALSGDEFAAGTHPLRRALLYRARRKALRHQLAAELTARSNINAVLTGIADVNTALGKMGSRVNGRIMSELVTAHEQDAIVLSTYLSSAFGYRRHIATGSSCSDLKSVILCFDLPRLIWVTEISIAASCIRASPGMRRIYGHALVDLASSGESAAGLLLLHLPGVVYLRAVNPRPGEPDETTTLIADDTIYERPERVTLITGRR